MEIITSLDNKKIKYASKLLQKKYRDIENKFLIQGTNLVREAQKEGILLEVFVCPNYEYDFNCPTTIVSYEVLKKLTNAKTPQKIIGLCQRIEHHNIGDKILILDNIQDPGNLGTIIRSCVAFNIDTLVISNDSVDLYNEKVIRASEGMLFKINIIRTDIIEFINNLKDNNYIVYATDVNTGNILSEEKIPEKFAIIMGNEGNGVKDSVKKLSDKLLYIPISKTCESLNVSIATSIILYEFSKGKL